MVAHLALTQEQREILKHRRQRLGELLPAPVLLWAGGRSPRNFPHNGYPYRASSHFLYFAGIPIEQAVIRLQAGRLELFVEDPSPAAALWHGPSPTREELAAQMGADAAYPLAELGSFSGEALTLGVQDAATRIQQSHSLSRRIPPAPDLHPEDEPLAQAVVQLRLCQDAFALEQMRAAAAVTVEAHRAGMAASLQAKRESEVRAAMEERICAQQMSPAYSSIVTVHGEVLHNEAHHHALQPGDLLLADVGAESPLGWAADVTRTWPVSGHFSATQRELYEVVRQAHDACIAKAAPGVEYRDLHLLAATVIATGLVELGILRGDPHTLVEQDAHALFFPHGVGHLLGLDVHDMEDLGDRAGYAPGRQRSERFGLGYLRLDRPLQAGMVVTIEPGFYQVPALLEDPVRRQRYDDCVNWERLAQFADVRGIRIEDDVLITPTGCEVLTAALPSHPEAIETWVLG